MLLNLPIEKIEQLSDENMQQLLQLELVHEVLESGRGHLQIAKQLLVKPTSVRLQPKSADDLARFIQKLCKKAELVMRAPDDGRNETIRNAASALLSADESVVPAAILFGRCYLASYLDRLSKS